MSVTTVVCPNCQEAVQPGIVICPRCRMPVEQPRGTMRPPPVSPPVPAPPAPAMPAAASPPTAPTSAPPQVVCRRCGVIDVMGAHYCARCGSALGVPPAAGFWIRVGAYVIDALILLIPNLLVAVVVTNVAGPPTTVQPVFFGDPIVTYNVGWYAWDTVLGAVLAYAYFGWFWTTSGQTPGMKATGVRVQGTLGQPVGWGTALVRLLMLWVSAAVLGLGLIWVAFQPEKRGWHDLAADTEVVHMT